MTPNRDKGVAMRPDRVDPTPQWATLQSGIAGEVALPGSPAYERGHQTFNARFHEVRPQAIVACATPDDVAETISFLARHGLECATRSGGHCFGGRSSTRGVVIDVTRMGSVSVSGGVATVGAGARLGAVYDALQAHGLAIPAGTCPPVGIAGLVLGGGLGILGRRYGVTSDHLSQAQIVLADGRIVECDEHHDDDLFWALRGAGAGNFGVVTSFRFHTVPAPEVTNFHATWPYPHAAAVVDAWQAWAPRGPDELAASLKLTTSEDVDQPPSVDLYGALLGTGSDATELLDELVVRAGADPITASHAHMSFPETRHFWAQLGITEDGAAEGPPPELVEPRHLVARSEFFRRPLPAEAIAALVGNLSQGRMPGESRELDFMPWGGAYNRVPPDATAFVHRDELFQIKHAAVVDPRAQAPDTAAAHRWVGRSWATVHPWGSGRVFQNFADPDLDDWTDAYYGTNYDRLVRVKARYDPADFFHFHQSLPAR
jgi:FAD/FMN-containing dehydrogenase